VLESILLQLEGLEIILKPIIDTQYFGCPDDCIVQGSQRHDMINLLFSPVTFIGIGVAIVLGLLVKLRKKFKKEEKPYESKSFKKYFDKKKTEKREFLQKNLPVDPTQAYEKFVDSLDSTHPQTDYIKTVHTETKEADLVTPEQKILEQQVQKMMKEEKLSEDKATDKVIEEMNKQLPKITYELPKETITIAEPASKIVEKPSGETIDEFSEEDIFRQDNPRRKYPVILNKLIKKFKKEKKEKTIQVLTELGTIRRDEYANIINKQMLKWVFPLQRYKRARTDTHGKKTLEVVNEIEDEKIYAEVKKLALFCSMAEFMVDKKGKKKRYWREIGK